MHQTSGIGSTSSNQASDAIRGMGQQAVEQTNKVLDAAKERGSKVAAGTSEMLSGYRSTIEDATRAQPIIALAVAALAGILFGRFWWGDNSGDSVRREPRYQR